MVQAWYMDNEATDQRLEHHLNPPKFISMEDLYTITGVEYFKLNVDTCMNDGTLKKIRTDRGYTYEDQITCSEECLTDYANKLKSFFTEHLHTDEEIRLFMDGSGYFDVRDKNDQWIRIKATTGDMLILPSGIYHRFTLDLNNYAKVNRYFIGEPVWVPHNRPCDEMNARKNYVKKSIEGF